MTAEVGAGPAAQVVRLPTAIGREASEKDHWTLGTLPPPCCASHLWAGGIERVPDSPLPGELMEGFIFPP